MKLFRDFGVRALLGTLVTLTFMVAVLKIVFSLPPDMVKDVAMMMVGGLISLATAIAAFYFAAKG